MTISLLPETQKLIEDKLTSGKYGSVDEVLQAALQALSDSEMTRLDDKTLDEIDFAEDQIERGEVQDWKEAREQVRANFFAK